MKALAWLRLGLLGCVALGLVACAKARPPITTTGRDLGSQQTPQDLSTPPDLTKGADFWEGCVLDQDCTSKICYRENATDSVGRCTRGCVNDCPENFACQTTRVDNGNEIDICLPAKETFCKVCSTHRDCGDDKDMCIDIGGARFCSINCAGNPGVCPSGFSCVMLGAVGELMNVEQCVPINNICCIDKDGDGRGLGDGCVTTDCNDNDKTIYDDAVDICDGVDNDCKGGVDDKPINCKVASCQLGAFGYFERAAEPCTAGACTMQTAKDCALYTCSDGGETGDHCATSCDGENDSKCIPPAHCEAGICTMDLPNGSACNETSDCQSDHCDNGFCCSTGVCCSVASDCPNFGTFSPTCDDPATCQGTKGSAACNDSRCGTLNGVPDDSACTAIVEANNCGYWKSIYCNGDTSQTPPSCPTTCATNADCDDNGFCDPVTSMCVGDLDDGKACGTDNARCKSGHCQNGFCCKSGDCCAVESDCPASYTKAPECKVPTACQGQQDIARCIDATCSTEKNVDNDAACDDKTLANDCGSYLAIYCNGQTGQPVPTCPTKCDTNMDCKANAYCNAAKVCVPDELDGGVCNDASQCQSAHCQNGYCCKDGDCCATALDCGTYARAAQCDSQTTCQGTRVDAFCHPTAKTCSGVTVPDDHMCAALQSNDCGPYPPVFCTAEIDQPADQAARCSTSCTSDNGCDASAHCSGNPGTCMPDSWPGGYCNNNTDCLSGFCIDHVCCATDCQGACRACNLPGKEGTCSYIPVGQDPDGECPGVSCAGYYWGWSGDSCYRKADVTAAAASCNGMGACRTVAQECAAQTASGSVTTTCDNYCQDPTTGTCTGTSAGTCTNVYQGYTTCGYGVCQNTVANCSNGVRQYCYPNWNNWSSETCNDIDDNCDGTIDNGSFADTTYEPNDSCTSYKTLPTAGSNQTITYNTTFTLYPSGDVDYFRIPASESDDSCACCDFFCTDEDYKLSVTLTVPAGAGSYQFCTAGACGSVGDYCATVYAGNSYTWTYSLDGGCPGNDDYSIYVRISAGGAPGYECRPYKLSYYFQSGLCL